MSDTKIQTLKGFRDFVGQDAKKRQWLIQKIKAVFERFGFEPLETPAIEYEALLLGKYGAEAEKLIYRFEDNGERKVALRYDQTVPTTRVISQYQNDLIFPYRRFQIQPVWRAEKPQKGRYREFLQCDADIFGSKDSISDAELLAVYYAIYKEIGIDSVQLKVNDRQQLIQTLKDQNVTEDLIPGAIQTIDKLDKKSQEDVIAELESKGVSNGAELISKLQESTPSENLQKIMEYARELGVPESSLTFSPELARGLDYYTGMIFEGIVPEYSVGSVGGGGRYDNLVQDLVGVDMPGVGFGLGFDRTLEAAEAVGCIPADMASSDVLVTIFDSSLSKDSLKITQYLRSTKIAVECYPNENAKMQKQMKYADRKGIPYVIIVGTEEKEKNVVQLKNMKTGEQQLLALEDVPQKIQHA